MHEIVNQSVKRQVNDYRYTIKINYKCQKIDWLIMLTVVVYFYRIYNNVIVCSHFSKQSRAYFFFFILNINSLNRNKLYKKIIVIFFVFS